MNDEQFKKFMDTLYTIQLNTLTTALLLVGIVLILWLKK